jgi:glucose/arabinose dehydrogenase
MAGGVYVLKDGRALKLRGSPAHVFGLAYSRGTLYVSGSGGTGVGEIFAWSEWNGTRFTKRRALVGSHRNFTVFNGLAVGRDGSLYAGVGLGASLSSTNDSSKGKTLYANDVVRVDPKSGAISVVASGMRQPWQLAFVPGHEGPLVTDLGQENLGDKRPADYVVEAKQGANFGFPSCPAKPVSCAHYDKPFAVFPPHSSPMGIAPLSGRLYLTLFTGDAEGPEVVSMSASGGKYAPVLVGFAAPVLALGARGRKIYVGDLTGTVYSFTP